MDIKEFINNDINQALGMDGGGCEYISCEDGILKVKLTGQCGTCPMSLMTLKEGIEKAVKLEFNNIEKVESI